MSLYIVKPYSFSSSSSVVVNKWCLSLVMMSDADFIAAATRIASLGSLIFFSKSLFVSSAYFFSFFTSPSDTGTFMIVIFACSKKCLIFFFSCPSFFITFCSSSTLKLVIRTLFSSQNLSSFFSLCPSNSCTIKHVSSSTVFFVRKSSGFILRPR